MKSGDCGGGGEWCEKTDLCDIRIESLQRSAARHQDWGSTLIEVVHSAPSTPLVLPA